MKLSKAELRFGEWARYADEDKKMAELALKGDGPPNQICFHSQQIAEKYLKGYLFFSKKEFEKTHLLRYLLDLCEEVNPMFRELGEDVVYLTQFYTETRYPGDIPEFTFSECQQAYEAALRIKEFILSRVKSQENKSGFGLIGIIIAVAVIGIFAGGGLYWQESQKQKSLLEIGRQKEKEAEALKEKIMQQQKARLEEVGEKPLTEIGQPKSQPAAGQIDTSNWKTYRNEKYGFEVKYPNDWVAWYGYSNLYGQKRWPVPEAGDMVPFSIGPRFTNDTQAGYFLMVYLLARSGQFASVKRPNDLLLILKNSRQTISSNKEMNILGKEFLLLEYVDTDKVKIVEAYTIAGDYIFDFHARQNDNFNLELFFKVISTLKLIK